MTRDQLFAQIESAKLSLAKSAIAAPHIHIQYSDLVDAIRAQELAMKKLEGAKARWLRLIEPALVDPLLRKIAEREGWVDKPKRKK